MNMLLNKITIKNHTNFSKNLCIVKKKFLSIILKEVTKKLYKFYKIVLYIFLKIIFNFIKEFSKNLEVRK